MSHVSVVVWAQAVVRGDQDVENKVRYGRVPGWVRLKQLADLYQDYPENGGLVNELALVQVILQLELR
jgi:hypothetical protein